MKKKLLLLTVLVMTFICLFAISASAIEFNGLYYYLDDKAQTATLTNENLNCSLETVNIPETITPVEGGITYTVTKIDAHAFSGSQSNWTGNKTIKMLPFQKQ